MKNQFTQHVPSYVEGVTPKIIEFNSLEELLKDNFFEEIGKSPDFYRFSLMETNNLSSFPCLIAEFKGGKEWQVMGTLTKSVELPLWVPGI